MKLNHYIISFDLLLDQNGTLDRFTFFSPKAVRISMENIDDALRFAHTYLINTYHLPFIITGIIQVDDGAISYQFSDGSIENL